MFGVILVRIFSAFSRIRTEYEEMRSISPYWIRRDTPYLVYLVQLFARTFVLRINFMLFIKWWSSIRWRGHRICRGKLFTLCWKPSLKVFDFFQIPLISYYSVKPVHDFFLFYVRIKWAFNSQTFFISNTFFNSASVLLHFFMNWVSNVA